jgi:anti-sigma factor RsiW
VACGRDIQRISAYHDGELPPGEAQELAEHIRQCPACRQELGRLRALSDWLSSAPAPDVSAGALRRLQRSLRPRRDRVIVRTAKALTAAAAAVLIACSVLLWQGRDAADSSLPVVAEWEQAAVMPASGGQVAADPAFSGGTEQDVDVQLARSILGSLSPEGGHGHE